MKYKYLLRIIAVFAIISFLTLIYDFYFIYLLMSWDIYSFINNMGLFKILEPVILIACVCGALFQFKYTPFLGFIYLAQWMIGSITLMYNNLLFENHHSPLYAWFNAFSNLLLSVLCIIGMIMVIQTKITHKE